MTLRKSNSHCDVARHYSPGELFCASPADNCVARRNRVDSSAASPRRTSPADYRLAFENISFIPRDGLTLSGWFIPAPHPRGTIIVCHGYTGDCSPDLQYAPLFYRHNYNALYFDFRGHGMSDGNYTSLVFFERFDLLAALDFLHARGITRVGLFGFSMGGADCACHRSAHTHGHRRCQRLCFCRAVARDSRRFDQTRRTSDIRRRARLELVGSRVVRLRANLFSADPIHGIARSRPARF